MKDPIYTKEQVRDSLLEIAQYGWHTIERGTANVGNIGNTLEDLLGIEENNLPIPNAGEWELKTYRSRSSALTTLFHKEPSPQSIKFVPRVLLPDFGWAHAEAGKKHSANERSFRQTIHTKLTSDRGFTVVCNDAERRVEVRFNSGAVSESNAGWLQQVEKSCGAILDPFPYWGYDDLTATARAKFHNCFCVGVQEKSRPKPQFRVLRVLRCESLCIESFIGAIRDGVIYVDFDARTGHNHGTKFRIQQKNFPSIFSKTEVIYELSEGEN